MRGSWRCLKRGKGGVCVSQPGGGGRKGEREVVFGRNRRLTVFGSCAHEANWSWDYPADQQLVVEDCRSAFLVWVDLHVLLLKTRSAVVGALA